MYERLYDMRNDFLHGNPVNGMSRLFGADGIILHKAAAPLYRMALAAAMGVRLDKKELGDLIEHVKYHFQTVKPFCEPQEKMEEAIVRALPPQR